MNIQLNYRYIALSLLFSPLFLSCTKNDPIIPNEGELITTIKLQFTDSSSSSQYIISFTDSDGDGGADPVIEADTLPANRQLYLSISLLNEIENPVLNLTEEILSEGTAHQFFFHTDLTGFSIQYADTDSLGNPIGLENEALTGNSGQGTLRMTLRHQPDKFATGVNTGDDTNAGGETDVELELPLIVQ